MKAGREGSPSGKALSSQSDGDPTEGQSLSLAPTPTGLLVLLARLFSPSLSSGQGGWLEQDRTIGGGGVRGRGCCGLGPVIPRWKQRGVLAYIEPKSDPGCGIPGRLTLPSWGSVG